MSATPRDSFSPSRRTFPPDRPLFAPPPSAPPAPSSFKKKSVEKLNPWINALLIIGAVLLGALGLTALMGWFMPGQRKKRHSSCHHDDPSPLQQHGNRSSSPSLQNADVVLLSNRSCGFCNEAKNFMRDHAPPHIRVVILEQGDNPNKERNLIQQYDLPDDGAGPVLLNLHTGFRQRGFSPNMSAHQKEELANACFAQ